MLSFSFPLTLVVGIISLLLIWTVDSTFDPLLSVNAGDGQERQRQQQSFISYPSNDDNGYLYLYYTTAVIKELENLIKNFEYTFDLEGSQIFPSNNIKQDIVSKYKSSEYEIDDLNHELLGFRITASDIKINVEPKRIDDTKTRVDIPLLSAKEIKVSNGGLINLFYDEVDLGSVYGVYDRTKDKMTVHVPLIIASKYVQQ